MFIIGITGGFGTGKTSVAKMFSSHGVKVIDADKIVHKLLKTNRSIRKRIILNFGKQILKNRSIDRTKLAQVVFNDRKKLKRLCNIIHPEAIKKIKGDISKINKRYHDSIVVIDAPLLLEANLLNLVDKLIVVKATKKTQIRRLSKYKNMSESMILKRINAQMPLKNKIEFADYLIDNNNSLNRAKRQVNKIWDDLSAFARRPARGGTRGGFGGCR